MEWALGEPATACVRTPESKYHPLQYNSKRGKRVPVLAEMNSGARTRIVVDSNLMTTCNAGPAVSLNGSPTVSPVTAALCASLPLPPKFPNSIYLKREWDNK